VAATSHGRPARRPSSRGRRRRRETKRRARLLRLQAKLARHRGRRIRRRIAWKHRAWWDRWPLELGTLERDLPPEYRHFARGRIGKSLVYQGNVELDGIGIQRQITIIFPNRPSLYAPYVMTDGPRPARHRWPGFRPTHLCLWYAHDPKEMRWTLDDGLARLIDLARVHLIRELWLLSTGTWPAPEHHQPPNHPLSKHKMDLARTRRRCWCGRGRYTHCHGAISASDELAVLGISPVP
jgi:hypothetical protein